MDCRCPLKSNEKWPTYSSLILHTPSSHNSLPNTVYITSLCPWNSSDQMRNRLRNISPAHPSILKKNSLFGLGTGEFVSLGKWTPWALLCFPNQHFFAMQQDLYGWDKYGWKSPLPLGNTNLMKWSTWSVTVFSLNARIQGFPGDHTAPTMHAWCHLFPGYRDTCTGPGTWCKEKYWLVFDCLMLQFQWSLLGQLWANLAVE